MKSKSCDGLATRGLLKVKNDHRSKFSNLRNWKEEGWKKIRAFIYTSHHFNPSDLASNLWLHSSVGRALHRFFGEVTGSNPVEALIFFRLFLFVCYDHSSLSECFLVTGKREVGFFKFLRFEKCFWNALFSWRIPVPVCLTTEIKLHFQISSV